MSWGRARIEACTKSASPCTFFTTQTPKAKNACDMKPLWFQAVAARSMRPADHKNKQKTVATNKCRSGCHLTPHFDKYYSTHELQIAIDNMHILQYINYKNTYVIHCDTMMYIPMCNVVMIVHRDMQLTGRVRYCMYVS